MLTLQQIIDEADTLVPNGYADSDKVLFLNEVNQDFFDKVKIPLIASFTSVANQAAYSLDTGIRAKNIDYLTVGSAKYQNLLTEDVNPTMNRFSFDDTASQLTLYPAPTRAGQSGICRYFRIGTTTFVSTTLTANPDAPEEYHWIYTLGLCEKIAAAMDDIAKANNYGAKYASALVVAAQNYQKGA